MKLNFISVLCALLVLTGFSACGNDDDDNEQLIDLTTELTGPYNTNYSESSAGFGSFSSMGFTEITKLSNNEISLSISYLEDPCNFGCQVFSSQRNVIEFNATVTSDSTFVQNEVFNFRASTSNLNGIATGVLSGGNSLRVEFIVDDEPDVDFLIAGFKFQ